jgi:hypothetical protein
VQCLQVKLPSLLIVPWQNKNPFLFFAANSWAADFLIFSTSELKSKLDGKEKLLLVNVLSDIDCFLLTWWGLSSFPRRCRSGSSIRVQKYSDGF